MWRLRWQHLCMTEDWSWHVCLWSHWMMMMMMMMIHVMHCPSQMSIPLVTRDTQWHWSDILCMSCLTVEWAALVDSWQQGCILNAVPVLLEPEFIVIPCKLKLWYLRILSCYAKIILERDMYGCWYSVFTFNRAHLLCGFNCSCKIIPLPPPTSSFQTPAGEISQIQHCLRL